ncbi:MAG: hypothetical protein ABIY55_11080 [Kofleriaceae bacterium]
MHAIEHSKFRARLDHAVTSKSGSPAAAVRAGSGASGSLAHPMHPVRTMVLTQKRVPRGALYASAGIVVTLLALLATAVFVIDLAALSTGGPGLLEVHRWTAAALTLAAATWLVVVTSNMIRRRARSGGRTACVPQRAGT